MRNFSQIASGTSKSEFASNRARNGWSGPLLRRKAFKWLGRRPAGTCAGTASRTDPKPLCMVGKGYHRRGVQYHEGRTGHESQHVGGHRWPLPWGFQGDHRGAPGSERRKRIGPRLLTVKWWVKALGDVVNDISRGSSSIMQRSRRGEEPSAIGELCFRE